MTRSSLEMPSSWGVTLRHDVTWADAPASTGVVLFPGDRYRSDAPLLYYARQVSVACGADVVVLEYGHQAAQVAIDGGAGMDRIAEECTAAVARFTAASHRRLVFVSKSLGTWVAGQVATRATLPVVHLWLTPVPGAIPAMRRGGGTVFVGSADPVFGSRDVAAITGTPTLQVTVVPDADHGLCIPADHRRSLAVLTSVADRCGEILAG